MLLKPSALFPLALISLLCLSLPSNSPAETPAPSSAADMAPIPAGQLKPDNKNKTIPVDAFFIDRYEVTQEQYQRVMGTNPSFFKGSQRPVENVNWNDADAFCRKTGKRLPTEWEWELAARAGSASTFYWGDKINVDYVWYKKNAGKQTHPVGLKKPNAFGLYDMSGNVWEWTASDHENGGKVMRGGSWRNHAVSQRSGHRILSFPIYHYHYVGFRCARSE